MSNKDSTFNSSEITFALGMKGRTDSKTRSKRLRLGCRAELHGERDNSAEKTTISGPYEQFLISVYFVENVEDRRRKENPLYNKAGVDNTRSDYHLLTVITSKLGKEMSFKKVSGLSGCVSKVLIKFFMKNSMIPMQGKGDLSKEPISLVKLLYLPFSFGGVVS